eukprot:4896055-Pleurochrysis_carterae.AAC.7
MIAHNAKEHPVSAPPVASFCIVEPWPLFSDVLFPAPACKDAAWPVASFGHTQTFHEALYPSVSAWKCAEARGWPAL